jgi:hypothetical protein
VFGVLQTGQIKAALASGVSGDGSPMPETLKAFMQFVHE